MCQRVCLVGNDDLQPMRALTVQLCITVMVCSADVSDDRSLN